MVAKPGATYASSVTPLTATAYTTTGSAEVRIYQITSLGDITMATADLGPSIIFICNLGLKDTSTVDASRVGLLSFDFHYQILPAGTVSEFL